MTPNPSIERMPNTQLRCQDRPNHAIQPTDRRFEFDKRGQFFIRVHNEALSVVSMRVCNPDRSPLCQVTLGLRGFFRVCFSPGYDLALAPRASTIFEPFGAVQK
jgi:hypothetical protein